MGVARSQPSIEESNETNDYQPNDPSQHNDINEHDHEHDNTPPAPYELQQYISAIEQCQLDTQFFLHPSQPNEQPAHQFDLMIYSSTASALLKAHDTLSSWRYRLVPSKINEFTFWKHTFMQLDWLISNDPHVGDDVSTMNGATEISHIEHEEDDAIFTTEDLTNQINSIDDADHVHQSINQLSNDSAQRIHELESHVLNLQNEIVKLRSELLAIPSTCLTCRQLVDYTHLSSPCRFHSGIWQPDQGTLDFLALDDELKANLRREKAKRLSAVKYEMRWIADTNDAISGSGAWSCCKKEYQADGCSNHTCHSLNNIR